MIESFFTAEENRKNKKIEVCGGLCRIAAHKLFALRLRASAVQFIMKQAG